MEDKIRMVPLGSGDKNWLEGAQGNLSGAW
jgi:hypothetical protein